MNPTTFPYPQGTIRANFIGLEFRALDDTNAEMALVTYGSNVLGARGPREMEVVCPVVSPDGAIEVWQSVRGRVSPSPHCQKYPPATHDPPETA